MSIAPRELEVLSTRLRASAQVSSTQSLDHFPPYLDSFLAHLRLLVGVPFQYLVPDARLLPDESIRFFYLDRSFTDRLVDGALAVGKVGTREMAHVQAHAAAVQQSADDSETLVRNLQRRWTEDYAAEKRSNARPKQAADTVTGFVLRSAMVSGWPHMEVRAFAKQQPLATLRMERLSPGVLFVLWRGVPDRVELEEPHHGVQFGVDPQGAGSGYAIPLRKADGHKVDGPTVPVAVPLRVGGRGVVHMTELRRRLHVAANTQPASNPAIVQSGPAAFAISLLNPPYQQPFAGTGSPHAPTKVAIAMRVADAALENKLRKFVSERDG